MYYDTPGLGKRSEGGKLVRKHIKYLVNGKAAGLGLRDALLEESINPFRLPPAFLVTILRTTD